MLNTTDKDLFERRKREKEESRQQDERDLEDGTKTKEELNKENSIVDWSKYKVTIDWKNVKH